MSELIGSNDGLFELYTAYLLRHLGVPVSAKPALLSLCSNQASGDAHEDHALEL